jgi:hypothetical protein
MPDPQPSPDQVASIVGADVARTEDPLDGSLWLHLPTSHRAEQTLEALHRHGIAADARDSARVHVTGWDARLLRYRLGVLLAGIDDLRVEWDATAELARYHYDRRRQQGEPEPWEVLADVEAIMRSCIPIPHHAPLVTDVPTLLELVAAAEDSYQQLISEHLDHAEQVLAAYRTEGSVATAEVALSERKVD